MRPEDVTTWRIAVDARYLRRRGVGISWYLHQAIGELLGAGVALTLLTDSAEHRAELLGAYPLADAIDLPGRSGFIWEQHTLRRHLARNCYDAHIAPANYGIPLGYRGPTRLILVVHDLIPLRLPHLYLLGRPLWGAKYLLSTLAAAIRADDVLAVSRATATDTARILLRPARAVVYPPIPERAPDAGAVLRGDAANQAGVPPTPERYFVYNGGLGVRKNVHILLQAFARVRAELGGTDLVMLGAGYESLRPDIERLGITDHVHLPGYVDEAAKNAILAGATALVYPSRLEGFGLPVVEAFAAGIPVVTGTGGALTEVGGDAATYVHPVNERSLAAGMVKAVSGQAREQAFHAGAIQLRRLHERRAATTFTRALAECLAATSRPA